MMTRDVFAISWAKVPATPKDTERNSAATKMCSQSRPRRIAKLRPCAFSRIRSVAVPLLMADLGATGHLAGGDGSKGRVFYRARGTRRHPAAHDGHPGV